MLVLFSQYEVKTEIASKENELYFSVYYLLIVRTELPLLNLQSCNRIEVFLKNLIFLKPSLSFKFFRGFINQLFLNILLKLRKTIKRTVAMMMMMMMTIFILSRRRWKLLPNLLSHGLMLKTHDYLQ